MRLNSLPRAQVQDLATAARCWWLHPQQAARRADGRLRAFSGAFEEKK
jgi:hypothetical protein